MMPKDIFHETDAQGSTTIRVPLSLRKRGGRKLVMMMDGQTQVHATSPVRVRTRDPFLRALVRAFRWKDLLESGAHATIRELAQEEQVDRAFVSHTLRLTLLAPDLVEKILTVTEWSSLQVEPLKREFPVEWGSQRQTMEFT